MQLFLRRYPFFRFLHTPKHRPARFDGIVAAGPGAPRVPEGTMLAIVETKCRVLTRDRFSREFGSKAILTADKYDAIRRTAVEWAVPFAFWFYLAPEDTLLVQAVCDWKGGPLVDVTRSRFQTRATCNGGTATRLNALIDMSSATVIEGDKEWASRARSGRGSLGSAFV